VNHFRLILMEHIGFNHLLQKKVANFTIENTLTVGAFGTDTLIQKANHTTGEEINMYSTTVTGDMFIGKVLPSPYTVIQQQGHLVHQFIVVILVLIILI